MFLNSLMTIKIIISSYFVIFSGLEKKGPGQIYYGLFYVFVCLNFYLKWLKCLLSIFWKFFGVVEAA